MGKRKDLLAGVVVSALGFSVRAADCNQNGLDDYQEIRSRARLDCNLNGIPDECDVLPVNFGLVELPVPQVSGTADIHATDLDGDGAADFVFLDPFGRRVLLFWNEGRGTLGREKSIGIQDEPRKLLVSDLDGDGLLDLAVASDFSVHTIYHGGGRIFGGPVRHETSVRPVDLAAGDLDGDGDPDLVVAGTDRLVVLLQSDARELIEKTVIPIGSKPVSASIADVNADGRADIITGNLLGNVSVILGKGGGTFELPRNYFAGNLVGSSKARDLDGDGDVDVVTANAEGEIAFLRNPGNGVFLDRVVSKGPESPTALEAGDLDQDGDLDLALASFPQGLTLLLRLEMALFAPPLSFPVARGAESLALADLDADGKLEAAVANTNSGSWTIFRQKPRANSPDCNADGVPDECQTGGNDCNANGVPDDCDLRLGKPDCDADRVPDECQADCNKNGQPDTCDLIVGSSLDCNSNAVPDECDVAVDFILRDVVLVDSTAIHMSLAAADLNGDGMLDLAAVVGGLGRGTAIRILKSEGGRSFTRPPDIALSMDVASIFAADMDLDRDADLVIASRGSSKPLVTLFNDGTGSFPERVEWPGWGSRLLAAGPDLDGDGDADLLVEVDFDSVWVALQDGRGTFQRKQALETQTPSASVRAQDFNRDGAADVLIISASVNRSRLARLYKNNGRGEFALGPEVPLDGVENAFAAADVNGDEAPDLVGLAGAGSSLFVLMNRGDGQWVEDSRVSVKDKALVIVASDLDADGDLDLALAAERDELFLAPVLYCAYLRNDGLGRFETTGASDVSPHMRFRELLAGDFTGDGLPDLSLLGFPDCPTCLGPSETSVFLLPNATVAAASRDRNHNHIPDECDHELFLRGDVTGEGGMNITDPIALLSFLFRGGRGPGCLDAADANDDGALNLTDAVYLLLYIFGGGAPPPDPGPPGRNCGPDPVVPGRLGSLGCALFAGC